MRKITNTLSYRSIDGEYVGQMVLNYLRSLQFGVKYIYETLPKLVTVWLDFAANLNQVGTRVKKASEIIAARQIQLRNINKQIRSHSQKVPAYIVSTLCVTYGC